MADLPGLVSEFAGQLDALIHDVFDTAVHVAIRPHEQRFVVEPVDDEGNTSPVALSINGDHLVDLDINYQCSLDAVDQHLTIQKSTFALSSATDRQPIVRFDYVRTHSWARAHINVHAGT